MVPDAKRRPDRPTGTPPRHRSTSLTDGVRCRQRVRGGTCQSSEKLNSRSDFPRIPLRVMRNAGGRAWCIAGAILCLAVASAASAAESSIVIERCSVFDPESGKMLPDRTIVIRATQIVRVAASDEVKDLPAGSTRIDGRGKFALP